MSKQDQPDRRACPKCKGVVGHAADCPVPALLEEHGRRIRARANRMMQTVTARVMQTAPPDTPPTPQSIAQEILIAAAAEIEDMGLAFESTLEGMRGDIDLMRHALDSVPLADETAATKEPATGG